MTGPTDDCCTLTKRAQRRHLAEIALLTFICSTSSILRRNWAVGLDVDLPRAAELVEVVHVERAHVDLQHARTRRRRCHAHRFCLDPVDVEEYPRRIGPKTCEDALQAVAFRLPFATTSSAAVCRALQGRRSPRCFDHQLEAAGVAKAIDRRSAEDRHHRIAHFLPLHCCVRILAEIASAVRSGAACRRSNSFEHYIERSEVRARSPPTTATGRICRPCVATPGIFTRHPFDLLAPLSSCVRPRLRRAVATFTSR